jgi:hypothetical protein
MAKIRDIAARCESIGRNCEFGLVQRNLNLEPVSLLRWAGSETPAGLIDGLHHDFAGLAEKWMVLTPRTMAQCTFAIGG